MLFTSVDFQKPGKQQGFLQVPYSHNLGGWANVMIPVTTVASGSGPTVFGIFDDKDKAMAAKEKCRELPYRCFVFVTDLYR